MTTQKTVLLTTAGNGTWTVPSDFVSLVSVEGIGGGCGGSPGFQGAVDLESLKTPTATYSGYNGGTFSNAFAGPGGYYCKATTATTSLAPGQVLNLHVGNTSTSPNNIGDWADKFFAGSPPSCLSDDTWIKDNGGHYIVLAPGGDSLSSPHGSTQVSGGNKEAPGTNLVTSAGGGASGGPAGVPDGQTQDGAESGFINPTQIKLFGSGGGSGNLTQSSGDPGIGNRTVAGTGGGSGASAGGSGGNITGNVTVSSSLLLPSLANPADSDGVKTDANLLLSGDFTIELWNQMIFQNDTLRGTFLSVWDIHSNQRSWMLAYGTSAYSPGGCPVFQYSTDGTAVSTLSSSGSFFTLNPGVIATYTSSFAPPNNGLAWAHIALCRAGNIYQMFINGFPCRLNDGSTYTWAITDTDSFFASTAKLAIGCTLNNNAVNTTLGLNLNEGPLPGWYGNVRITKGTALYSCATTSVGILGQQFTPPTAPLVGGTFSCDWPGAKGATSSTATGGNLTFVGAAVIDSDQYCYPPSVPEIGGNGVSGSTGNLWGTGYGPGGGGGGGGGDFARYRMLTGGAGGNGGLYGGGGGQGGGVNSGIYNTLGRNDWSVGLGGTGAQGIIAITYNSNLTNTTQASVRWM